MSDLFDSYYVSPNDQLVNAKELIQWVKNNDNVVALWGNHDLSYLNPFLYKCSGYSEDIAIQACNLLVENEDVFTYAYEYNNILFTHAGVSTVWFDRYNRGKEHLPIDVQVNNIVRRLPTAVSHEHNMGRLFRSDGDEVTQGPTWIRPSSLISAPAHPFQVVGHTQQKEPYHLTDGSNSIILVDSPDYYTILDGKKFSYHKFEG